jgi:hypothetical protein
MATDEPVLQPAVSVVHFNFRENKKGQKGVSISILNFKANY